MRWAEIVGTNVKESATAGATGAASIATCVGGLGSGFNAEGHYGIYEPARKKKKPILLKR